MRLNGWAAALAMGIALAGSALATSAGAGWLSRIAREAAETGGSVGTKIAPLGIGALDNAASVVASLPKLSKTASLAAHVTPEGHWKFANREGQLFTAATPDELARVRTALLPESAPGENLAFYLSEETVFRSRTALKELPADADLHIVVGTESYKLRRGADVMDLTAEIRPNLSVEITGPGLFNEAVYRLSRALNRSNMRVLALEPGGPQRLSSVPRFDPATKAALVDEIDPTTLPQALSGLKGQTAIVSGRVENGTLRFRPSKGPEQSLDIARLVKAAEEADVNLVVIGADAAHQPGGRNWFWQRVAVAGLDDALKRATFGDFLTALGDGGELVIKTAPSTHGRVVLSALPKPASSVPLGDTMTSWIGEMTGHVAVRSLEVFARDAEQERELEARFVPGIPSLLQTYYAGAIIAGLIGWPVSAAWWRRLWPREERSEYAGRVGYVAARIVRALAFTFLFLPIVGFPAFLWSGALSIWGTITAPFKAIGRLVKRARA